MPLVEDKEEFSCQTFISIAGEKGKKGRKRRKKLSSDSDEVNINLPWIGVIESYKTFYAVKANHVCNNLCKKINVGSGGLEMNCVLLYGLFYVTNSLQQ